MTRSVFAYKVSVCYTDGYRNKTKLSLPNNVECSPAVRKQLHLAGQLYKHWMAYIINVRTKTTKKLLLFQVATPTYTMLTDIAVTTRHGTTYIHTCVLHITFLNI